MSLNTILATAPLTATGYILKATGTALGQSLIWDNGTNVGIGNTNTSYTLDVTGTGRFSSNVGIGSLNTSWQSTAYALQAGTTVALSAYGLSKNLYFDGTDYRALTTGYGTLLQSASGNFSFYSTTASVTAGSVATLTSSLLTIASTGAATFSSSVGVGAATNVNGTLEVWGSGASVAQFSIGRSASIHTDFFIDATGNTYIQPLGVTKLTLLTTGNMGIGTTTIPSKLTVNGTFRSQLSDANDICLSVNPTSSGVYLSATYNTTGSYQPMIFEAGGSERMRIRSDGSILFSTTATLTTDNNTLTPYSGNGYLYLMGGSTGLGLTGSGNRNNGIYINSTNNELYFQTNNLGTRMMLTSGGNLLIGTTTDSSYKLAVASGIQYLGAGFQITGTFGQTDRQCATAFADFAGTSVTFDLASLFPRTTFLNRGLCVTMQLVALPTYTIVSSAFVVLGRTGNSNVWSNNILANININGAAINSVTASGTVITVNYSTYIFGTAYINLATIG